MFIKLTIYENGKTVNFNSAYIISFYQAEFNTEVQLAVYPAGMFHEIIKVVETAENILKQIYPPDFNYGEHG
jgi:hypothetical protein